jgi:hypothetical protein
VVQLLTYDNFTKIPRDGKFEKWINLRVVGSIPAKVILYNQSQNYPMGM